MTPDEIRALIKTIPDVPHPPILFRDIFPIFQKPEAVRSLLYHLGQAIQKMHKQRKIDAIVGLDARGFLVGPQLAMDLGCAFVPVRKKGKLPGECHQVSYVKEYGTDSFEMQKGALQEGWNVVIVDDLLATGGTVLGAMQLIQLSGAHTAGVVTVVELEGLGARDKILKQQSQIHIFSLFQYQEA